MGAQHAPQAARDEQSRLGLAAVGKARLIGRSRRLGEAFDAHRLASSRIIAAAFSAIIRTGELVLPDVMRGMTEASAMRKPRRPRTLSCASTTAAGSSCVPIFAVPTG